MHGELYAEEFGFDQEFELGITAKMLEFSAKDDGVTTLWICEHDGRRIGSVAVSRLDDCTAFLNFLLVLPAYRRQAVAGKLLDTAIEHAKHHGFKALRLETYSCLENARKLYHKRGFIMASDPKRLNRFGRTFNQEFMELGLESDRH